MTPPPIWLSAQKVLYQAMPSLPAEFPKDDRLLSPRTEAELEEWTKLEASRRGVHDAAVREWLSHHRWPATLDATDAYLLSLRVRAAIDWLELGRVGAVFADQETVLLSRLLLDGWHEVFREQHCQELRYRLAQYSCGFHAAGGFAE